MSEATPPTISFIIPTHPEWAPYARRFLVSLAMQTVHDFEVVFGVDGGDDGRIAELADDEWPFAVVVVDGPRPKGDKIPHRNHARNAAIRAARGRYAWVADTDFVWVEHAVEHALAVIGAADARGELVALTPVLKRITVDPTLYVAHTDGWGGADDRRLPSQLVGELPTDDGEWSGQGKLYDPSQPRVVPARVEEGFPLVPIAVLHALGLFDERFLRWGGNKIELCFRLTALGGVGLPYRLLASVAAWHQPHPQDPNKPVDDPHRVANHAMYLSRVREVRANAAWWVAQRRAVQRVIVEARREVHEAKPAPAEPPPPAPTPGAIRVGLVTVGDRRKGLARDVELIELCLRGGPLRRRGKPDPVITRYTLDNPAAFVRSTTPSLEGMQWSAWLDTVDVVLIPELLPVAAINVALARGRRVVYVPNADWAEIGGQVGAWINMVRALAMRDGFEVWAKSAGFAAELKAVRIRHRVVPWIALDEVAVDRPAPVGPVRFFASVGMGGFQGRRGVAEIVAAWRHFCDKAPDGAATLTIKSARPLAEIDGCTGINTTGITVIVADWTREQIAAAWADADVVLYPTKWDGFGLSLSEALNAGCPVIAPRVWPMAEQVTHGHDGLLLDVPADVEPFRMAPVANVDPLDLAAAMQQIVDDRDLLRRLTCPQPGRRRAVQRAMRMWVRARLLDEPEPALLIVRGDGPSPAGGKRSELWWRDAFELCGFRPLVVTQSELQATAPGIAVDFVIVGKCQPADVDRVRGLVGADTPVVCWHLDLTDYTDARDAWQRRMLAACDVCVVSEGELGRYPEGRIVTVYPGQEISAVRPTGYPVGDDELPLPPVVADTPVVFLGGCFGSHDSRVPILRVLRDAGVPVNVHGPPAGWKGSGFQPFEPAFGMCAAGVYVGRFGLSVSRTAKRAGYTSNRLFNVLASGAVPLVQRFPGVSALVPDGAAVFFDDPADIVAQVAGASAAGDLREIQWRAVETGWRRHTWEDRALELLDVVQPARVERPAAPNAPAVGDGAFYAMWDARARQSGPRAVAHIAWNDAQFEQATREWWQKFRRQLGRYLKSRHQRILDYGCGVGRFTQRIVADLGREAVGVDISPTMVDMARGRCPGVDFRVVNPGAGLPFADETFDVIFACTVLQHIPDDELPAVVAELNRVRKRDSVVFLFENTHPAKRRKSYSGHVVFRGEVEYRRLFPGVGEVESWYVEGEKHAILAGRCPK